ncbi:MAG TPA: ABC transporter permease [Chitinophagaceae bacterium]|nr:ABC transporter permease [Chitinophagaceae bacterium]
MIKNYFKIAWRNLMKNKTFSFINVFGLAIGLTSCMLITLYLYSELTYDSYHKNIGQLYQLGTTFVKEGKEDRTANTPAPMARTMQQEFPEIERTTRLMKTFSDDKTLLQYASPSGERKSFYETKAYLADSTFFQVFTYKFIEGDPATALSNPNSLVLSKEIARKLFGNESAINKVLRVSSSTNGDHDFNITGVFEPAKIPTHIDARFFMSIKGGDIEEFAGREADLASNNMFHTYLVLRPGSDPKKLEAKFPAFIDKYAGKDLRAMGFHKKQFLTAVRDIHLFANTSSNVTPQGSVTYLYILASIAVFTLLIACINFMNLSTARSSKRSAEVGVRKVLGAERKNLIWQFLGESVLMSLIAFAFALGIAWLLLPLFAEVSGKEFSISFQQYGLLFVVFLILAILTGLLAGSYPAFYLSSFIPVKVLKGKISNSLAAVSLRKTLVVFQFVISVVLIIASVVISNQMRYLRTKDLGFAKDQQIIIPLRSSTAKNIYPSLKTELSRQSQIRSVGATQYYPGIMNPSDMGMYKEGDNVSNSKRIFMNWVDDSYLQTLDIKPVAGRLFSKEFPADTNLKIILNEQGIKQLGFPSVDEAVGKNVQFDWQGETYRWEVIGIVRDFHFQDLHVPVEPYGFQLNNRPQYNYMIAHVNTSDMPATLKSLGSIWQKLNPNEPFEYSFLDQDFYKNYEAEERLASIVGYFTIIAILISCLGLFGLAAFSAEQRIKEIGVRKVLGASVGSIVSLLSKDFLKLVGIAILIASPIAWFAMNKWLQDFAYRTNIGWQVFLLTAAIALCIAILTVSFQAIRAAVSNPVKSLRTE